MLGKQLIQAASGSAAAGGALYVDDVFSTFLYAGNSSSRTITNNIDLSGEGGLVWIRTRAAGSHRLIDTERGATKRLSTDSNNPEGIDSTGLTSFTSTGFTLGSGGDYNDTNDYASWSFRKAPGFFDVVTWAGDGTSGRQIAHNLGSVPGFIMIKSYVAGTGGTGWMCYHRSLGNTKAIRLDNGTAATSASSTYWNNTDPTSTHFTVGNQEDINTSANSRSYVAYVFAHDSAVFGTDADESIIKCGTYTGNGSTNGPTINLGFEPQWLMTKRSNSTGNWTIYDAMRGAGVPNQTILEANQNQPEDTNAVYNVDFNPTGFQLKTSSATFNGSGDTFIYVAIRRPHKPPTAGTDVFAVTKRSGTTSFDVGFPTDVHISTYTSAAAFSNQLATRLTNRTLDTNTAGAEANYSSYFLFDLQNSFTYSGYFGSNETINYNFKRAPGFFDVVTYTGNNTARTISHNLEVAPEFMLVKSRSFGWQWCGYSTASGAGKSIRLSSNVAAFAPGFWSNTAPTSSVFTISAADDVNENNGYYVAYLFATLTGISKVGSYTGTGNAINVDCGFSAGARFILIKRTDSTGDWFVYDTARGIASGNDPYLLLNTTATEVTNTDYIDPLSSGFTVTSSAPTGLNASGGTYLFLAIA